MQDLDDRNVQNALIVMDNAKYHKFLSNGNPKGSWKKQQMMDYYTKHNIPVSPVDSKGVIWDRLKNHVNENIKTVIFSMAEAAGHQVVWPTPYYLDQQQSSLSGRVSKG